MNAPGSWVTGGPYRSTSFRRGWSAAAAGLFAASALVGVGTSPSMAADPIYTRPVDVIFVIDRSGSMDEVTPDPSSPIAGMPIINVDKARTVVVIKRSLSPGFAGIPNPLFANDNTLMYFADGKKAVVDLINAMKAA